MSGSSANAQKLRDRSETRKQHEFAKWTDKVILIVPPDLIGEGQIPAINLQS